VIPWDRSELDNKACLRKNSLRNKEDEKEFLLIPEGARARGMRAARPRGTVGGHSESSA